MTNPGALPSLAIGMPKESVKKLVRFLFPLAARKQLAVWLNRREWVPAHRKEWWTLELLRDYAVCDINKYHKFLWSHHMAYARTYEAELRFGYHNMPESRKMFFSDLKNLLECMKVDPGKDITSVFEVGCSLGYQLRYIETDLFPGAREIRGIDIDRYSIQAGSEYLRKARSKVELAFADMEKLEEELGDRRYDVVVCTGTLMYLNETSAARVVEVMLRHTGTVLAIAGLASPGDDNSAMEHSVPRAQDKSFVHNIDAMVKRAGGQVLARRWSGGQLVDSHTIYFVFASQSPLDRYA